MKKIDGRTRVCGLMANPVEHTLSPLLHNLLSEKMGINLVYVPFKPEKEGLKAAVEGAYALNILGLNVSVPYKKAVMESLSEIDKNADAIGAVNTLVRSEGGYKGYNTDYLGLKKALEVAHISIKDETVIIFGAGGTAKSAAYLCCQEGAAKIYLCNRTKEKAAGVIQELKKQAGDISMVPLSLEEAGTVEESQITAIQTTSVGMHPDIGQAIIEDPSFYHKLKSAYDVVYTPFETRFLKYAKDAGAETANGLTMLLYQGIIAYELWNGIKVVEETAESLYESLKKELKLS